MTNIFKGLEKFGLTNLSDLEIYKKKETITEIKTIKVKEFNINDYVYLKTFECPVCFNNFVSYVIRARKLQPVSIDYDLRPIFKEPIQPLFYDILSCYYCGYTSISQKFSSISENQAKKIKEVISPNFKYVEYPPLFSIEMAIERYKLALLNSVIKDAKDSEKAYICMKLAWLYRTKKNASEELNFIEKAYTGFLSAFQSETMPVCGLDENLVIYLMAAFANRIGMKDEALKFTYQLIHSKTTPSRLKERARDLKDSIKSENTNKEKIIAN